MNVYVPPIIEKVYNVQGSTAAPGSGEYHRYRATRRKDRTISAALEKEYKAREIQREFEEKKKTNEQIIEITSLKKKQRRIQKEEKKKMKRKMLKSSQQIFDKSKPLIDQLKEEMGEEEFKKILSKGNEGNDLDYDYDIPKEVTTHKIQRNYLSTALLNEDKVEEVETKVEDKLQKLFPVINDKQAYEFENYDDYEEHLQVLEVIERHEKKLRKEEESESVKYKEVEQNIILHDDF